MDTLNTTDLFFKFAAENNFFFIILAMLVIVVIASYVQQYVLGVKEVVATNAVILYNRGALFIDTRKETDFNKSHINGSININFNNFAAKEHLLPKNKEQQIIVYSSHGGGFSSLVKGLKKKEFINIKALKGGFISWQSENYPVSDNVKKISKKALKKSTK